MSRVAAGVAAIALLAACAGPEQRVEGVVIAVDGGLAGVVSFTIVTGDGDRITFIPDDGVTTFAHGGPLSHLHEHLQTASPVRVTWVERDGVPVALAVADAG